ncbi:MAG: hypothetical protein CVT90_02515 [Candidatus Altiarchaeales archaeon HGW-Altiarchaeales-3]|nr:MAG: hypothetical protein CVT90_02515 [Candidatus Altiarchaeales archaeon HGW-Altiarchaeales-3]
MDKLSINKKEWDNIEKVLLEMIPDYDDINGRITFWQDKKWRKAIARMSRGKDVAVEVGSGPGTLAVLLESKKVICVDPIPEMNEVCEKRIKLNSNSKLDNYKFITAPAESIPLPDNCADIVYCAFSFRDFYDKKKGLLEMHRILKKDGELIILDIAKHDGIYGKLIHFYMSNIAPVMAFKQYKAVKCLAETYKAFAPPKYYEKIMSKMGFNEFKLKFFNFKTIFLLKAKK